MSGNKRSKRLIAAVLCMAMTGSILAYLPDEVSAQTSTEVVNGSFEVGYAGMDVYGWHLTAMADELAEGIQTDANATVQSLEAYTLKTEELESTDRSKVAALTKYGKGTVAMTSQAFTITGGGRYTVSYDAVLKDWTPTAPGVQVAVKEMTTDGTLVKWTIPTTDSTDAGDMTTSIAVMTDPTAEWTTVARTFEASENATQAELYIWVGADDDMTGTILFDKVAVSTSEIESETTSENPISSMMEGGDANSDSESNIDICDVIHMKKYLADEDVTVSDSADMNKNELINEDDLTLLRWKLLGVETTAEADKVGIRTDLSNQLSNQAQDLINSIYALPAVSKLQGISGSPLEIAKLEFAKVNNQIKAKVSNRKTLTALENSYNQNYKMLYSLSDTSAFSIHPSYKYDGITFDSTPEIDATYGNVLRGTSSIQEGSKHLVLKYEKEVDLEEQLSGYEKVCFYVYNGQSREQRIICNFGGKETTTYAYLAPEVWTKIEVPIADFISGNYFGIYNVGTGTHEFKFSAIWAEKDNSAELAQPVIEMIEALPALSELQGYHQAEITAVRTAYDALSDGVKAKVSNYATLTALENAYNENYKMLYSMSDISGFTEYGDAFGNVNNYAFESGKDETYGNVLHVNYNRVTTGDSHIAIKYTNPADIASQLAGYEKVCFYVYNGHSAQKNLLCNFNDGKMTTSHATLAPRTWTKVEVSVENFIKSNYIGVLAVGDGTYEFKFSAIWAESYKKAAQSVINMINALPNVSELKGYHLAEIQAARAAYGKLSEGAKLAVSNLATLTGLESAYETNYKMIHDMSNISGFTEYGAAFGNVNNYAFESGKDETYGNVLHVNYNRVTTGDSHIAIKYTNPADIASQLAGYEKVCFYVYNGHSAQKNLLCNFNDGKMTTSHATLAPRTWTKVEVSVENFIKSNYIGVLAVGDGTYEFKFSAIWAEKANPAAEAQPVIDMIDALPTVDTLEGYHFAEIQAAKVAYGNLSDGAKSAVSNSEALTALESAYNEKYKMLYDMSDISIFKEHTQSWAPGYKYSELSAEKDKNYGNLLTATLKFENTVGGAHLAIEYPTTSQETLSGYDNVCFYVYHDRPRDINMVANFTGKQITNFVTLKHGEWTKVTVPATDFEKGYYFGVLDPGYVTETQHFKFSAIWAVKAQ